MDKSNGIWVPLPDVKDTVCTVEIKYLCWRDQQHRNGHLLQQQLPVFQTSVDNIPCLSSGMGQILTVYSWTSAIWARFKVAIAFIAVLGEEGKGSVPVDKSEIILKLTLLCLHSENHNRKYHLQGSEQQQGAH